MKDEAVDGRGGRCIVKQGAMNQRWVHSLHRACKGQEEWVAGAQQTTPGKKQVWVGGGTQGGATVHEVRAARRSWGWGSETDSSHRDVQCSLAFMGLGRRDGHSRHLRRLGARGSRATTRDYLCRFEYNANFGCVVLWV
ncbi:hypothetical protein TIFTF001_029318 [Ficus carica]|uniref:Uncharacterized protein n=1 Tax=Ficus carica TaxID=3494 RepID=A0AA88DS57_FICCA|nr:hypothetical protein TIFTF001_029318 [Ficus carica]